MPCSEARAAAATPGASSTSPSTWATLAPQVSRSTSRVRTPAAASCAARVTATRGAARRPVGPHTTVTGVGRRRPTARRTEPSVEPDAAPAARRPPRPARRVGGGGRGPGQGREGAGHCGGVVAGAEDRRHAELAQPPLPSSSPSGTSPATRTPCPARWRSASRSRPRRSGETTATRATPAAPAESSSARSAQRRTSTRSGAILEDPHELGLVAVRDRREDAGHDPAAATPPGTGTRVMRAPRSTSATTARTVLARHHDVDGPGGRGAGEHPVVRRDPHDGHPLERPLGAGIRGQPDGGALHRAVDVDVDDRARRQGRGRGGVDEEGDLLHRHRAGRPDPGRRDQLAGAQVAQRPGVVADRPVGGQVGRRAVTEEDVDAHDVGVGEPLPRRDLALGRVDRHPVVGAGDDDRAQDGGHQHEQDPDEQARVAPRGGA